jgi:hypothetical protein
MLTPYYLAQSRAATIAMAAMVLSETKDPDVTGGVGPSVWKSSSVVGAPVSTMAGKIVGKPVSSMTGTTVGSPVPTIAGKIVGNSVVGAVVDTGVPGKIVGESSSSLRVCSLLLWCRIKAPVDKEISMAKYKVFILITDF